MEYTAPTLLFAAKNNYACQGYKKNAVLPSMDQINVNLRNGLEYNH
jgi:hypothetical protein